MSNPRYRNASGGYIVAKASSTDTTTVVKCASRDLKVTKKAGGWDTTCAEGQSFGSTGNGTRTADVTFDLLSRSVDVACTFEEGAEYYVQLFRDRRAVPYEGTLRIGQIDDAGKTASGELIYSITASFQGPYNSPEYPTCISDAAAGTGRFAAGYIPTFAPNAGGAGGVTQTGGASNAASQGGTTS